MFFSDLPEGCVLLHGAGVMTPAGALLILGHSGSGKSTLSTLLSRKYPLIADDLIIATPDADRLIWTVENGLPRRGEITASGELLGFLRIYQAPEASFTPITPRALCRHLVDSVFEVPAQRKADRAEKRRLFTEAAGLARTFPGWEFHFAPNQAAIDLIDHHFQNSANIPLVFLNKEAHRV